MEQEIVQILSSATKWGSIAIASYFVLRPLVNLFVDWARDKMNKNSKGNNGSISNRIGLLEKQHKKMQSNDLHHIEADIADMKKVMSNMQAKQNKMDVRIARLETKIFNGQQ